MQLDWVLEKVVVLRFGQAPAHVDRVGAEVQTSEVARLDHDRRLVRAVDAHGRHAVVGRIELRDDLRADLAAHRVRIRALAFYRMRARVHRLARAACPLRVERLAHRPPRELSFHEESFGKRSRERVTLVPVGVARVQAAKSLEARFERSFLATRAFVKVLQIGEHADDLLQWMRVRREVDRGAVAAEQRFEVHAEQVVRLISAPQ